MVEFAARDVEVGLLFPHVAQMLRVPEGWTQAVAPGLPVEQFQFFRVLVSEGSGAISPEVVLFAASLVDGANRDSIMAAANLAFPEASVLWVTEDGEGKATVLSTSGTAQTAFAVALVKRSCGWDESIPICIRIGEHVYDVRCRYENEEHRGSVVVTAVQQRDEADRARVELD